jgi:hypothetical protein
MTNCCDDYGNCNQGRDCPIRQDCELPAVDHATDYLLPITCVVLGIALGGAFVLLYFATTFR